MDFKTKRLIRRLERKVKKLGGELEVDIIDTKHQNNWWECFLYLPDGRFIDMMMALESDWISEAILEVADSMDEILEYGKEH